MIDTFNKTLSNAAQGYARQGWAVFPCNVNKSPLTASGYKDATTDEATVKAWWERWPDASIGIPTGAINGIVVLDIDMHGESNGFDSLEKLTGSRGCSTRGACTGGGGRHFYFKHPGSPVPNSAGMVGPGLDVRGDGGYVILSPSGHPSGQEYRWLNSLPIEPTPEWLTQAIDSAKPRAGLNGPTPRSMGAAKDPIPNGQRNDTLFRIASGLRAKGMEEEELIEALLGVNQRRCTPPLDDEELEAIATNVCRYELGERPKANQAPTEQAPGLNDDGNACRFVIAYGHKLRYVPSDDQWRIYDGSKWKVDKLGEVTELAKLTARSIYAEASISSNNRDSQEIGWWAGQSLSKQRLTAFVDLAKTDKRVAASNEWFDTDPFKLNVLNGTINLKRGNLERHSPNDLITKQAPIAFNAAADCPRFLKFLNEITAGDGDLQRFIQKTIGYCLTGETKEQVFFILHGFGANGKSVFLKVMSRLLGDYATTTDFSTFLEKKSSGPRNDLAALPGSRFVCGSEIGAGGHLDETVIKQVTGEDTISARKLYKEAEEFVPTFKVFLATNHLPNIRGTENGIWRRIRVIPFDVVFDENSIDKDLHSKLAEELPGILNWAIQGCLLWQQEGLEPPTKVTQAGQAYRLDTDTVEQFLVNACVRDSKSKLKASEFYNRYQEYCEDAGLTPIYPTTFGKKLNEKGIGSVRSDTTYRVGIRMMDVYEKQMQSNLTT